MTPSPPNPTHLAKALHAPFELASRAQQVRKQRWSTREAKVQVRLWTAGQAPELVCDWQAQSPSCPTLASHQGPVAIEVDCKDLSGRSAFLAWLCQALEHHPQWSHLGPYPSAASSTHRSWLVSACRILTPAHIGIEARVDKLGPRSAQLCLNFGADTLAAPLADQKRLPLAGVVSPHETSRRGLCTLIEQAGLTPAS